MSTQPIIAHGALGGIAGTLNELDQAMLRKRDLDAQQALIQAQISEANARAEETRQRTAREKGYQVVWVNNVPYRQAPDGSTVEEINIGNSEERKVVKQHIDDMLGGIDDKTFRERAQKAVDYLWEQHQYEKAGTVAETWLRMYQENEDIKGRYNERINPQASYVEQDPQSPTGWTKHLFTFSGKETTGPTSGPLATERQGFTHTTDEEGNDILVPIKTITQKVPMTGGGMQPQAAQPSKLPASPLPGQPQSPQGQTPSIGQGIKIGRKLSASVNPRDTDAIADAIVKGDQPPTTTGLYRSTAAVRAALAKKGYNLTGAQLDYSAIQRYMASLNGPQQLRLRQAVQFAYESLPVLEKLYAEWKALGGAYGYRVFNKATLAASKQVPGQLGAAAQALETQIADMTSELGTVYKGGNSSTNESLDLAAKNLSSDWNEETFNKAISLIRTNLNIRKNSILNAQPAGMRSNSPYLQGRQESGSAVDDEAGKILDKIGVR